VLAHALMASEPSDAGSVICERRWVVGEFVLIRQVRTQGRQHDCSFWWVRRRMAAGVLFRALAMSSIGGLLRSKKCY
jgi:hypothetical protein